MLPVTTRTAVRIVTPADELTSATVPMLLGDVQSPPFDCPIVVDLSTVRRLHPDALLQLFDTLRWRLVWSPLVLCVARRHLELVERLGVGVVVPVRTSVGDAVVAARLDDVHRGPGRRGLSPLGTFGIGGCSADGSMELAIRRVDAMRRERPLRRAM